MWRCQLRVEEGLQAAAALPADALESVERKREAGRRRLARAAKQRLQDADHVRCPPVAMERIPENAFSSLIHQ